MLSLSSDLRSAFKRPFGPVYADAAALLSDAGRPVIAVGDVVTYHLRTAGHHPAVSVIDGRTEREAVDAEIREALSDPERRRDVANEPGQLDESLLVALADTVAAAGGDTDPVTVVVDGEEDLATLPVWTATSPAHWRRSASRSDTVSYRHVTGFDTPGIETRHVIMTNSTSG
jgi:uncharacterized protein (UPF0218 family)